ncbi:MAG TPA: alpha/beta fold hydrolase, partial [Solimonas sp.]|nr:alpha/beta fold hydrolase [Solimonas sp.]
MNPLRALLGQGLVLNERLAAAADNAFDWLFMRESLVRSGQTPYDTILEGDPMSVRYYPPPNDSSLELADGSRMAVRRERHAVPLVLVPPLGVTTETFDLMPNRSLVRYMAARGFRVYLIDWGKPEKRHAHLGMRDYADTMMGEALAAVRRHAGVQPLSLMGWCMGGLLCLLHAGLGEDRHIRNLITVASPIDLRGGGVVARAATAINGPARLVRRFSRFRLSQISPDWLHAPAWMTTLGFKLTDPVGSITTYWDLLTRLWDRDYVESHTTTAAYLNNMLLYPGGVIQDMVVQMAVDNRLAEGRIQLGRKVSDLSRIKANFHAFAGDTDHLVPAPIARQSVELVSSRDKQFRVAPGGHMGVILGSKAQGAVWNLAAGWLDSRSALRSRRIVAGPGEAHEQRRRRRLQAD